MSFGLGFGFGLGTLGGQLRAPAFTGTQLVNVGRKTLLNRDLITALNDSGLDNEGGPIDSITLGTLSLGLDHWESHQDGVRNKAVPSSLQYLYSGCTATGPGGTSDPFDLSIVTEADAYTVVDVAGLEATAELAALAYGDTIYLRSGIYNPTEADTRIKRTVALTGTFTAPSDKTPSHQGPDLDTGNYVLITNHIGATPIIKRLGVDGNIVTAGGFRFKGLTFNRTATSEVSGINADSILSFVNGIDNCAVDNCTFQSTQDDNDLNRYPGIRLNAGPCDNIKTIDNTFNDTWIALTSGTENNGLDFIGNTVVRAWNDGWKINFGDNMRASWNVIKDKQHPDVVVEAHGDFGQWALAGAARSIDNIEIIGNLHWRGAGRATFVDGQSIFLDDLPSPHFITNLVIRGNTLLNTMARGISATRTTDAIVRNNTVVRDKTINDGDTGIFLEDGTGGVIQDNIANSITNVQAGASASNNVLADRNASAGDFAYASLFDDPDSDADVTDLATQYSIKTGSVADTPSPKVGGAGTGYVDYTLRTTNFPSDYTQNLVDNAGTAYFTSTGLGAADTDFLTFSAWIQIASTTGTTLLFDVNGRTEISIINGRVDVFIRDTAAGTVWDSQSTTVLSTSALQHVHVRVDISGGVGNEIAEVYIDGSLESMTDTVAIIDNGNAIDHTRSGYGILASDIAALIADVNVSDYYLNMNAALAHTNFIDSGNPVDISAVGSPEVFIGNDMTADERDGNALEGWNDGHNLGSGGALTVGSATFVDV